MFVSFYAFSILSVRYARNALSIVSIDLMTKGAPGKITGAAGLVKYAKSDVIMGGPMIEVALIKLVNAPCNNIFIKIKIE